MINSLLPTGVFLSAGELDWQGLVVCQSDSLQTEEKRTLNFLSGFAPEGDRPGYEIAHRRKKDSWAESELPSEIRRCCDITVAIISSDLQLDADVSDKETVSSIV